MTLRQAEQDWKFRVFEAFRDKIHYDAGEGRWWSRHPESGQWQNDRMLGRRFMILSRTLPVMGADIEALPPGERRLVSRISNRQGQYVFLSELSRWYWDLPFPEDFHTNRERR